MKNKSVWKIIIQWNSDREEIVIPSKSNPRIVDGFLIFNESDYSRQTFNLSESRLLTINEYKEEDSNE